MNKKWIIVSMILVLILTGCSVDKVNGNNFGNNSVNESEATFIKFFYPDSIGMYWLTEEIKIDSNDLVGIIEYLRDSKRNAIPMDTKVLGVEIKDRVAFVNLSKEFDNPDTSSSYSCRLKIYSIVNVLCLNEVFNIDGVRFLIDGKEVQVIGPMMVDDIKKPTISLQQI